MSSSRALPRGRHRLSRETVTESQRARLLDAIVELVAGSGYARTTVGGIAATAGVSRSTFYEQFSSKEDCFRCAFDSVAEQVTDVIVAAGKPIEDPRKALAASIEAYVKWFAEHPHAAATFIVEVHKAGPEALDHRTAIFRQFCEVLDRNSADREPAASMAVVTSIDAMAYERVRKGRAAELPSLSADALHVALKLLT